jgi:hypothetical protein
MLDTLFASELATAAYYAPAAGGGALTVALIWKTPDVKFALAGAGTQAPARTAEIRAAELAAPQEGDVITVAGTKYTVANVTRDRDGLLWRLEVE